MTTRDAILCAVGVAGTRGDAGKMVEQFLLARDGASPFLITWDVKLVLKELELVMRELREELRAIDS